MNKDSYFTLQTENVACFNVTTELVETNGPTNITFKTQTKLFLQSKLELASL